VEERYQDAGTLSGLTHAAGINLVARERWNFGGNVEIGTLVDSRTSAETDRKAAGFRIGYGWTDFSFSSGIEYRRDDQELLDLSHTERTTWLFRNRFKLQLTPDWRMVGKVDHSFSDSSLGDFYQGGYTEVVLGYAYRPVRNDRLNALAKYTFFDNVPTPDQLGATGAPAEFLQRSHIASVDLTYDITSAWTIGGKYAYRLGEVSLDRCEQELLRQHRAPRAAARGLEVPQELGVDGRGTRARPSGRGAAAHGRARAASTATSARTSRSGGVQLHRLLRRPHRPQLRPPGVLRERGRDDVVI
jgi:hypothetical protein